LSTFEFWPKICVSDVSRLHYIYEILSVCMSLSVAFKFLIWSLSGDKQSYKHIPVVGAFSHNFKLLLAAKLLFESKKLAGYKNGTDLLYHNAKYGGDRGSRACCRPKSVMFLFLPFLSHFGIAKFVITEKL